MKPALEFAKVWKGFGPGLIVLRSLTFSLDRGEVAILVGENGAGKTTAFEIASGTYRPDRGRVLIHGRAINGQGPEGLVALGLLRMRQAPAVFRTLPIQDAILVGKCPSLYARFLPWPSRGHRRGLWDEVRVQAAPLFRVCPFLDDAQVPTGELSYGQQRIVDFLRVYVACGSRSVLLLDEPFAGIQAGVADVMWQMICGVASAGSAVLVIEHEHEAPRFDGLRRMRLRDGTLQ